MTVALFIPCCIDALTTVRFEDLANMVILLNIFIETCAAPAQCQIIMRANPFPLLCGLPGTDKSSTIPAAFFFEFKHGLRSYEC